MSKTVVFILAGGSGTRLAPLSLTLPSKLPKQFLALVGERTMLQQAVERIPSGIETIIVPEERYLSAVKQQTPDSDILAEPFGCNTAPAIGLSALYARAKGYTDDTVLFFLPADHIIDAQAFQKVFKEVVKKAQSSKKIVTIGILPDRPETGYGYIQSVSGQVSRFVEKPDQATAQRYLDTGDYYWNAGMFAMQLSTALAALAKNAPFTLECLCKIDFQKDLSAEIAREYTKIKQAKQNISIDYAVMEKEAANMVLVPGGADLEWNDVGGWVALSKYIQPDPNNNLIINYLKIKVELTAQKDLLVVASDNGILITTQALGQRAKEIIPGLTAGKTTEAIDCQNIKIENTSKIYLGVIGLNNVTVRFSGDTLQIL